MRTSLMLFLLTLATTYAHVAEYFRDADTKVATSFHSCSLFTDLHKKTFYTALLLVVQHLFRNMSYFKKMPILKMLNTNIERV